MSPRGWEGVSSMSFTLSEGPTWCAQCLTGWMLHDHITRLHGKHWWKRATLQFVAFQGQSWANLLWQTQSPATFEAAPPRSIREPRKKCGDFSSTGKLDVSLEATWWTTPHMQKTPRLTRLVPGSCPDVSRNWLQKVLQHDHLVQWSVPLGQWIGGWSSLRKHRDAVSTQSPEVPNPPANGDD